MISPAKYIDSTLLKAEATSMDIAVLCEEAVEYGFASVCIPPCYVAQACRNLYGSEVAVCTVVGFPLGNQTTETKVFETRQAVSSGAGEIDMVINIGSALSADYAAVKEDISRVVDASEDAVVKVIIECCLFSDNEICKLVDLVAECGADYVKTSTGWSVSGATLENVGLLCEAASARIKVKAAGGVRNWPACQEMISAGASRIGTSSGAAIVKQWQESEGLP